MKKPPNMDNGVLWATLSEAMSTGVFGPGRSNERSELRNTLLPVVANNADGEELLAGSYDTQTGTVWLTRVIQEELGEYVDGFRATVVMVDERGTASSLDLHVGTVSLSPTLGPDADLELVAELESGKLLKIGRLKILDSSWTRAVVKSQSERSFVFGTLEEDFGPS